MKSMTHASQENALKVLEKDSKGTWVISISDRYGPTDITSKVRAKAIKEQLLVLTFGLDGMVEGIDPKQVIDFIKTIPEDGVLIVHCTEGRYRSLYLTEVIRDVFYRAFDVYIEFGDEVLGAGTVVLREDNFTIIRPLYKKFMELLKGEGDANVDPQ